MGLKRKLIRNGNGWALCINSTLLNLLEIDPQTVMVCYNMENDILKITKSEHKKETRLQES